MFKRIKQYGVARGNRRKLLENLEEIKNEDLFSEGVEIQSDERIRTLNTIRIQVSQTKRYKKRIPVRVGVA